MAGRPKRPAVEPRLELQQWLTESGDRRTFVLRGDDESLYVKGQSSCLSYLTDLNLSVEYTVQQEG